MHSDDRNLRCKVCGFKYDEPPWGADGKSPSFDICVCCGCEFGYNDATAQAVEKSLLEWLASGAKFFMHEHMPPNWHADAQLAAIGVSKSL